MSPETTGDRASDRPLDGVRVLDLSRLLPGPACTWYLAGQGARIDRVEPTRIGDPTRALPPFQDGVGVFFAALNAGDRSLALDLRHPSAPAVLARLLPHYDVLVEGFRPGVLEALGLGPDVLAQRVPRLVVARLSGFGQTGPWASRAGHDLNYQALAGVLAMAGLNADGAPHAPPVQAADLGGALLAAFGIVSALLARERTGRGRVLDVSLAEAALSLVSPHVSTLTAEARPARPGGELLTGAVPVYGTYRCKDGRWITVGALEPRFQAALAAEVGPIDQAALREVFATRDRDDWVDALEEACAAPVLDPGELADHPQLAARGAVQRLGRTTFVRPPLAPADWAVGDVAKLGQHSAEILGEAGFSAEDLAALRGSGAVR